MLKRAAISGRNYPYRVYRRHLALACLALATVMVPGPALASEPLTVTVGIQFATNRSHAPTGQVSDESGDRAELDRLTRLLDQSDDTSVVLLVDPATRSWLRELASTGLKDSAEQLLAQSGE